MPPRENRAASGFTAVLACRREMARLRVLALASYPERAACTRFRIGAYRSLLAEHGVEVTVHSVLDDQQFARFYRARGRLDKAANILAGTARQLGSLIDGNVDVVFVQREATLIGPAFLEWIAARFRRLPLVFDLDDAIWRIPEGLSRHPLATRLLRWPLKTWSIVDMATAVVAGSNYLARAVASRNANVTVLPTVVSRRSWVPLPGRLDGAILGRDGIPVVGWIGSHSTSPSLHLALPALRRLRAAGRRFTLRVIGASEALSLPGLDFEARPWRIEREVEDFKELDIGIAPVLPTEFAKGKCAFKQLQYMAVGAPSVSSPEGGALDFVRHGENGLLAQSEDEWFEGLRALLDDATLRGRLARAGRDLVEQSHSIEAQAPRLADVLRRAAER